MPEIDVRGARFHVQRLAPPEGSAPAARRTVVFLHGLVMDNLSSWYFTLANPAATVADVVLYDLRGHGRSTRTPTGYRLEDMVADLAGVLDALAVERPVTLVANSFGGMLGLGFALAHPARVDGLVLVDAHVPGPTWARDMQATLGLQGEERDLMIARSFKNWLGRHSERKRNRLAQNAHELVYETSLVEDLGTFRELSDDELARIRCPVLAFYGEDSDIRAHGERLARALPDCELRIFPGSTHSIIWERTAELREQVVAWLARPPRAVARPAPGNAAGDAARGPRGALPGPGARPEARERA